MLTNPEAEEAFKDIQYAAIVGASSQVNPETRRRFALHLLFNPSSRSLLESLHGITRDIDYSRAA